MRRHRWSWGALALALWLAGAGCGRMVHVKGIVSLDGQPVERAVVVFERVGGDGHPAVGMTNHEGVFELSTFKTGDGVLPGEYKVMIVPPKAVPDVVTYPGIQFAEVMAQYTKGMQELKSQPPPFGSDIPAIYRDAVKTPLRQTVPPDGEVRFDLPSGGAKSQRSVPKKPASKREGLR